MPRMKRSNALPFSIVLFVLSFELSFVQSLGLNLLIIGFCLLFLILKRHWISLGLYLILPFLAAAGTYFAIAKNGSGPEAGLVLATRTYALAGLGFLVIVGINLEELLLHLGQKGLPHNFVYGLLVVVHAVPMIKAEVSETYEASLLRRHKLHFWSPMLYVKLIYTAMRWRDDFSTAMFAHGYDEEEQRGQYWLFYSDKWAQFLSLMLFIGFNLLVLLNLTTGF